MFTKFLSTAILAILVLGQGALSVPQNSPCGAEYDPPCPKGQFCCVPGPITVGTPRKPCLTCVSADTARVGRASFRFRGVSWHLLPKFYEYMLHGLISAIIHTILSWAISARAQRAKIAQTTVRGCQPQSSRLDRDISVLWKEAGFS
ncbi:hypothetical protein C8R44DRAFT_736944 [Mycena epipterygia]|nr:hypothetical protein C8R44DRAFT_736944 [Mycena epipterygia]